MSAGIEMEFWSRVDKSGVCWVWQGGMFSENGYGNYRRRAAHRVAYELCVGPVPDGLTLDHLCRNKRCVNPAHLEPVTTGENVRRGIGPSAQNARKTHCKRGHEFAGENLRVRKGPYGSLRMCRECGRAADRVARAGKPHNWKQWNERRKERSHVERD